jgi:hypothetical protein
MEYFRNHPEKGIIQLNLNKQTVRNLREQVRNHPNNQQHRLPQQDEDEEEEDDGGEGGGDHLNLKQFQFIQANATKIEISEIQKKTSSLLFLPFYLILLKYRGRTYHLILNGITQKIHGERPWSWQKAVMMLLTLPFSFPIYYIWNMFFSYDYFPKKYTGITRIEEVR